MKRFGFRCLTLAACSFLALPLLSAQTFTGGEPGVNGAAIVAPPVPLRPSAEGSAIRELNGHKVMTFKVRNGVYTVDGWVAKMGLNYTIADAGYLYFYMPDAGVARVGLNAEPNTVHVRAAFDGEKLAFDAGGHHFELTSEAPLLATDKRGKDTVVDAYVGFDSNASHLAYAPMMGFGSKADAYAWNGGSHLPVVASATVAPLPNGTPDVARQ